MLIPEQDASLFGAATEQLIRILGAQILEAEVYFKIGEIKILAHGKVLGNKIVVTFYKE